MPPWARSWVLSQAKGCTVQLAKPSSCLLVEGRPGLRAPAAEMSQEGAVTGDGFADDQILHLIRTFIGIQGLGIGEEARDVVVGDDAVAAQDLASPSDRLARFRRAERLPTSRIMSPNLP